VSPVHPHPKTDLGSVFCFPLLCRSRRLWLCGPFALLRGCCCCCCCVSRCSFACVSQFGLVSPLHRNDEVVDGGRVFLWQYCAHFLHDAPSIALVCAWFGRSSGERVRERLDSPHKVLLDVVGLFGWEGVLELFSYDPQSFLLLLLLLLLLFVIRDRLSNGVF
jgi:hypothetical protein